MKKEKKLKMSNKVFRIIMSTIMAIFLIFAVVLTTVTNYFTPSLDTLLGKGKKTATTKKSEGEENRIQKSQKKLIFYY